MEDSVQSGMACAEITDPYPRLRRIWHALQWLRAFSWPRRFPIVQFPNLPLALAFVSGELARHTHGSVHAYALAISYLAMAVWAWLELTDGVNWFRRLLGAYYVASTSLHLAHTLHHR
ncbi:MAG TPA: hypothetical protein VGL69_18905 [Solirubrobacteraceae bacterium]